MDISKWMDAFANHFWLAVPAAIGMLIYYGNKFRNDTFLLSQARSGRIFELTKDWRNAEPLALQLAIIDAFRVSMPSTAIKFVLEHDQPWKLIRLYKRCPKQLIRIRKDGQGFDKAHRALHWNFETRKRLLIILATAFYAVFWLGLMVFTPWLRTHVTAATVIAWMITAMGFVWFLGWMAAGFETAIKLVRSTEEIEASIKAIASPA